MTVSRTEVADMHSLKATPTGTGPSQQAPFTKKGKGRGRLTDGGGAYADGCGPGGGAPRMGGGYAPGGSAKGGGGPCVNGGPAFQDCGRVCEYHALANLCESASKGYSG